MIKTQTQWDGKVVTLTIGFGERAFARLFGRRRYNGVAVYGGPRVGGFMSIGKILKFSIEEPELSEDKPKPVKKAKPKPKV